MSAFWTASSPCLHYRSDGAGPVVLLLHEIGGSLASWDRMVAQLDRMCRLIRFDQRGAGWSEKPRESYTQRDLVGDALRVLDACGCAAPVTVCAVASACATAAELAILAPQRVNGLVLLSPGFGVEGAAREATFERAERTARLGMAAIVDMAMERTYPPALRDAHYATYRAQFLASDPVAFAQGNRAFADADADLGRITVPVILAPGEQDIRPVSVARAAAERMACARIEVIPAAGHLPHVQAPAASARFVRDLCVHPTARPGKA